MKERQPAETVGEKSGGRRLTRHGWQALALSFAIGLTSFSALAQGPDDATTEDEKAAGKVGSQSPGTAPKNDKIIATLRSVRASIASLETTLEAKRAAIADTSVPADRKEALMAEISDLNRQVDTLRHNFEELAAGIDIDEPFDADQSDSVDLGSDMREFLSPIVSEFKELTSRLRQIESLRRTIEDLERRRDKAVKALENLGVLKAKLLQQEDVSDALLTEVSELFNAWKQRLERIDSSLEVNRFELEEVNGDGQSVIGTVRSLMASFFRSRGRNLLFAGLAFGGVLFLARLGHKLLIKWSPLRKIDRRSFYLRLADVIYFGVSVLVAVIAALVVLYSAADWVLLGLALLFLAGIAWTGKHTLPQVYDQIKLTLNLGPVREDERVIYNSAPWKVGRIGFYTDLTNETLEGGRIRLPIRELANLHSRPFGNREPWFPSEHGHWVLLSDGVFGRVVLQTPDWVELVLLGGSRKTYTVGDFVALSPENLSRNFRIRSVFGIDYAHQSLCTMEIPTLLRETIRSGILESGLVKEEENLVHLAVEFSNAGASSLDYTILADFKGAVAQNYNKLQRLLAKLCVDACNENGWVIPFTQVTLHQAVSAPAQDTSVSES